MTDTIVGVMKKVAEQEAQRIQTTELGIVTAIFPHTSSSDHDNYQCSVKLKNRKLANGSEFELRQVPISTPYMGFAAIPNVGDLVLVSFVGGDINAPIVTGCLYNAEDRPPLSKKQEFLIQHSIKDGPSIKLDSQGKLILTSRNKKNTFTVENDKVSVLNEKFSLVIDISGKKISITSDQDVEIDAQNGKLTLHGNQVDIVADGAMTLKGKTIDLN